MKSRLIICITIVFLTVLKVDAQIQQKAKYDTLYYFLDLSHTPFNDRMITVDSEARGKFYTINCSCLKNNGKPQFRCDTTRRIAISYNEYKKIKFITLPNLIELVKKSTVDEFREKHVVYFVQSLKTGFVKNRALLIEHKETIIIDYDTVYPPKKQ